MYVIRLMIILFPLLGLGLPAAAQDQTPATISGTVYDLSDAVIPGVRITIENTATGEIRTLRTDGKGKYSASVSPSRYKVTMQSSVGYPIPYAHSSFRIAAGEQFTINFRPLPFSISDTLENGKMIERYEGALPQATTYYVRRADGVIRDVQIQSYEVSARKDVAEHRYSVIASVDNLTIYANKLTFELKKNTLQAEGNVRVEIGQHIERGEAMSIILSQEHVITVVRR